MQYKFRVLDRKGNLLAHEIFHISFGWFHLKESEKDENGEMPIKKGMYKEDLEIPFRYQYIGITDKNGNECFVDDVLQDESGEIFRIYLVEGGFAIKASAWAKNIDDLVPSDELIMFPCAQTKGYIKQSCEVIGKYFEKKLIKNIKP